MKYAIYSLIFFVLLATACQSDSSSSATSEKQTVSSAELKTNTNEEVSSAKAAQAEEVKRSGDAIVKRGQRKESNPESSRQKQAAKAADGDYTNVIDYGKLGISKQSLSSLKKFKVGSQVPDFTARTSEGESFNLDKALEEGDVVLVFYRGHWCPYCTKYLESFATGLDVINQKGARVIAIAPEGSGYQKSLGAKLPSDIDFISDSAGKIMRQYGVGFTVNDEYNEKFSGWKGGQTLASINGQSTAMLPIPATYLIGKDRKVKWSHWNPDYSKRPDVDQILRKI